MAYTQQTVHETVRGLVFNIQRYSIHDGPGIRTVVFLKGCPLRCKWCDNPESQKMSSEIMFFEKKCIGSGSCIKTCKNNAIDMGPGVSPSNRIIRARCDGCGNCADQCPSKALQKVGETMTSDEVLTEVLRDIRFYRRSHGGLTISGGEPLAQSRFTMDILRKIHGHDIQTAIETSGYADWRVLEKVLEFTDLVLYDIKHMNSVIHKELTGVSNRIILENLKKVIRLRRVIMRVPLIPTYNDTEENLIALQEFAKRIGVKEINLLPFHQLGRDKYERLNMKYVLRDLPPVAPQSDGKDSVNRWREILASDFAVTING